MEAVVTELQVEKFLELHSFPKIKKLPLYTDFPSSSVFLNLHILAVLYIAKQDKMAIASWVFRLCRLCVYIPTDLQ